MNKNIIFLVFVALVSLSFAKTAFLSDASAPYPKGGNWLGNILKGLAKTNSINKLNSDTFSNSDELVTFVKNYSVDVFGLLFIPFVLFAISFFTIFVLPCVLCCCNCGKCCCFVRDEDRREYSLLEKILPLIFMIIFGAFLLVMMIYNASSLNYIPNKGFDDLLEVTTMLVPRARSAINSTFSDFKGHLNVIYDSTGNIIDDTSLSVYETLDNIKLEASNIKTELEIFNNSINNIYIPENIDNSSSQTIADKKSEVSQLFSNISNLLDVALSNVSDIFSTEEIFKQLDKYFNTTNEYVNEAEEKINNTMNKLDNSVSKPIHDVQSTSKDYLKYSIIFVIFACLECIPIILVIIGLIAKKTKFSIIASIIMSILIFFVYFISLLFYIVSIPASQVCYTLETDIEPLNMFKNSDARDIFDTFVGCKNGSVDLLNKIYSYADTSTFDFTNCSEIAKQIDFSSLKQIMQDTINDTISQYVIDGIFDSSFSLLQISNDLYGKDNVDQDTAVPNVFIDKNNNQIFNKWHTIYDRCSGPIISFDSSSAHSVSSSLHPDSSSLHSDSSSLHSDSSSLHSDSSSLHSDSSSLHSDSSSLHPDSSSLHSDSSSLHSDSSSLHPDSSSLHSDSSSQNSLNVKNLWEKGSNEFCASLLSSSSSSSSSSLDGNCLSFTKCYYCGTSIPSRSSLQYVSSVRLNSNCDDFEKIVLPASRSYDQYIKFKNSVEKSVEQKDKIINSVKKFTTDLAVVPVEKATSLFNNVTSRFTNICSGVLDTIRYDIINCNTVSNVIEPPFLQLCDAFIPSLSTVGVSGIGLLIFCYIFHILACCFTHRLKKYQGEDSSFDEKKDSNKFNADDVEDVEDNKKSKSESSENYVEMDDLKETDSPVHASVVDIPPPAENIKADDPLISDNKSDSESIISEYEISGSESEKSNESEKKDKSDEILPVVPPPDDEGSDDILDDIMNDVITKTQD